MGGASVTVPLVDIVVEPVATRASWFRSLNSQVVGGSLHIGRANSFVVSASGIRQEGWFGASQSVYAKICRPHHDDIAPSGVAGWGTVQSQPTHRGGANGAANSRVSRRGLLGCPVPHHIADILGAVAPRDSQCMDAFQQYRKQQCAHHSKK